MSSEYQIEQEAPTLENATEPAKPLLESAQSALGFVPNMYRHMAKVPGLLSSYMHGYEQFRENSGFDTKEQEVVFLTISRENGCAYCMAAHSMLAEKVSGVPGNILKAIRSGKTIPDDRLETLSQFTQSIFQNRGKPSQAEVARFLDAGFGERHILDIILALSVKTLSNYSNHINHPELDEAFAAHHWEG